MSMIVAIRTRKCAGCQNFAALFSFTRDNFYLDLMLDLWQVNAGWLELVLRKWVLNAG